MVHYYYRSHRQLKEHYKTMFVKTIDLKYFHLSFLKTVNHVKSLQLQVNKTQKDPVHKYTI